MTDNSISVIIPAHNAEKTITSALQSVLGQTHPAEEIIIAIDSSTDSTSDIVESFAKDLLKKTFEGSSSDAISKLDIIYTDYASPSEARNAAIDKSTCALIAFLDADDIWAPDKTALQLEIMESYRQYSVVCSDWTVKLSDLVEGVILDPNGKRKYDFDVITRDDLLILNRFQTSTVIMKRSVIDAVGHFDRNLDGAEDWEFWIRSGRVSDIAKINLPLVYYRNNPAGYSKNLKRHYLAARQIIANELPTKAVTQGKNRPQQSVIVTRSPAGYGKISCATKEVRSWHYLRFLVAFLLIKEYANAAFCLRDLLKDRSPYASLQAGRKLLYPFLKKRKQKRSSTR
jgi:glycosyltransferase involved in cell wall biosynthesis